MNGSAFDQPLCVEVNADPTARPPAALPVEAMTPPDLPHGAAAQAEQLLREGYLVTSGCLSKNQIENVKRLLDETAASRGTEDKETSDTGGAQDSDYVLESVFNFSPSYLPLIDQVSLERCDTHIYIV